MKSANKYVLVVFFTMVALAGEISMANPVTIIKCKITESSNKEFYSNDINFESNPSVSVLSDDFDGITSIIGNKSFANQTGDEIMDLPAPSSDRHMSVKPKGREFTLFVQIGDFGVGTLWFEKNSVSKKIAKIDCKP